MISYRNVVINRCCVNTVPPRASLTAVAATSWRSLSPLQVSSSATHPPTYALTRSSPRGHFIFVIMLSLWSQMSVITGLSHNFWGLRGARWNGEIKQTSEKYKQGEKLSFKLVRFNQKQQNYRELNTQRLQQSSTAMSWVSHHMLVFHGGEMGLLWVGYS